MAHHLKALQLAGDEGLTLRKTLFETLFAILKQEADPLQSAVNFTDRDVEQLLDLIFSVITDLLRLQLQVLSMSSRIKINAIFINN